MPDAVNGAVRFRCRPTSIESLRAIAAARSESDMNTMPLADDRDRCFTQSKIRSVIPGSPPQSSALMMRAPVAGVVCCAADTQLFSAAVEEFKEESIFFRQPETHESQRGSLLRWSTGDDLVRPRTNRRRRCICSLRWKATSSFGTGLGWRFSRAET